MLNGDKLKEYIKEIKQATYGSEVRSAMADALEYLDGEYDKLEAVKDEVLDAKDNVESIKADLQDKVEQLKADREKLESLQEELEQIKGVM